MIPCGTKVKINEKDTRFGGSYYAGVFVTSAYSCGGYVLSKEDYSDECAWFEEDALDIVSDKNIKTFKGWK